MSGPQRQHYVPQTYLKQFSYDDAKNPHICVKSKDKEKPFKAGINKIAVENNFYTVDESDNIYKVEEYFSKEIEPELGELLRTIRKKCENVLAQNKTVVITQEEKERLSKCILAQLLRVHSARAYLEDIYEKLLPGMLDDLRSQLGSIDAEMEQVIESYSDEDKRKHILMDAMIKEKPASLNVLQNMLFLFVKINGKRAFVTSDNPIVVLDLRTKDATPFANGLADISTAVYYPLSPKLLLRAIQRTSLIGRTEQKDCSLEIIDANKKDAFIDIANRKQWEYCCHGVYSQNMEELERL